MAQVFDVTVTVTKNNLPMLKARGKQKAQQAVRRAAFNTHRYSAPLTPVDTGVFFIKSINVNCGRKQQPET